MILTKENFIINMIQINKDKELSTSDISNFINGFSNNNVSPILDDNSKYKIIFENLEIGPETDLIIFQVSLKLENNYYNPYLFLPINNRITTHQSIGNGRSISYNLSHDKFNFVWMYFTRDYVDKILNNFEKEKKIIPSNIYIQEYI